MAYGSANVFNPKARTAKVLGTGTDYNALFKPGLYLYAADYVDDDLPVSEAGFLTVCDDRSGTYVMQRFVSIYSGTIYTRAYIVASESWTDWTELAMASDLQALQADVEELQQTTALGITYDEENETLVIETASEEGEE